MKNVWLFIVGYLFIATQGFGQMTIPREIRSDSTSGLASLPPSNSVTYMQAVSNTIWIGTSHGLARTEDFGTTWQYFHGNSAFANNGIFSFTVLGNAIWAATGYDFETDQGSVQTGSGYAYSLDNGASWDHIQQPLDDREDSIYWYADGINDSIWILPIVVPQQNVTFDISLTPTTVWIASWSSGLRRSTNNGANWERILLPLDNKNSISPTDTLWTYAPDDTLHQRRIFPRYDPRRHNNLLAFSVYAVDDDTIWCGTAGGINKSTDGGVSWVRFTHQNQTKPILGNWVITIDEQKLISGSRMWATNWRAADNEENDGVSYSDDYGQSWTNLLHGSKTYDFAFKGDIVYIAGDDGIFRTEDLGKTFTRFNSFSNQETRAFIPFATAFSVEVVDDTVYVGTDKGLVKTIDTPDNPFGSSWSISKAAPPGIYAYPNPFSPNRDVDGYVSIHYDAKNPNAPPGETVEVTIELFDFSMNRVLTLLNKATRDASRSYEEIWYGRDDNGVIVPNGVYFYRLVIDNDEPLFGKILVMQ